MNWRLAICLPLLALSGCEIISPFVSQALVQSVCDRDQDGLARSSSYCGGFDCDDDDATVGKAASWYRDVDGDTYGAGQALHACAQPDGYVNRNGDCDDTDELVNPDGTETCNGYDDDCDGEIDEENIPTWYADLDEDTYGDPQSSVIQCDAPDGYVSNATDCDDTDALVSPDGIEVCDDGIDQDCNGIVDDAQGYRIWYADADADGYGDAEEAFNTCIADPEGFVSNDEDCNDDDALVNPTVAEICNNGIDDNCNGEIDTDATNVPWHRDADGDGYGHADDVVVDCGPPVGYVENATDCDDGNPEVHPGVEEVCNNGIDDNCDDVPDPCQWSGTISLMTADAIIDGTEESGYAAFALANAGDLNADGYDDLLVSASQVQKIHVFFGPVTGTLDVSMADITLTGPEGSYAGMAVIGSCDLQADGSANDLLIGDPYDADGGEEAGAVWIIDGPLASGTHALDTVAVTKLTGDAESHFGASVACRDQDGDNADDLLIGASHNDESATDAGAAYLGNSPVSDPARMFTFWGEEIDDAAGTTVLMADVNADGFVDSIVGAFQQDEAGSNAGAVYMFLGPVTANGSLADADVKLLGENASDFAGRTIVSGDVDGDGDDDLVVGAHGFHTNTGAAYIVHSPPFSGSLGSHPRLEGETAGDNASFGLAPPCDFDGDDALDLFIGAREESSVDDDAGAAYLLQGPVTASIGLESADAKLTGATAGDFTGATLTTLEMNADSFCDLVVGAYLGDYTGTNTGRMYVLYGLGL